MSSSSSSSSSASTDSDAVETAPLEVFIQRALDDPNAKVFPPSKHLKPPMLLKGYRNTILTYRGSFIPPHQGHRDTICHAFFRGRKRLEPVGAIAFALSDDSVRAKYKDLEADAQSTVLTVAERTSLISNSGIYGGWLWCYPGDGEQDHDFLMKLRKEASKNGFTLNFCPVTGPDLVGLEDDDEYYTSHTIVVGTGDPERTAFRAENETGLRSLVRYNDWAMEELERDLIEYLATEGSAEWLEQRLIKLLPDRAKNLPSDSSLRLQAIRSHVRTGLRRIGQNRICHHGSGRYYQWIRYVPTRFFGMTGGALNLGGKETQLSSTKIRRILADIEDEDEMVKALSGTALNPALLFQYIQRHKQEEEKRTQYSEKDTDASLSDSVSELYAEGAKRSQGEESRTERKDSFR